MFGPCFGKVHKDILLGGNKCPMALSPLQAPLVEALQRSAVILRFFAIGNGIHIANEAYP